MLQSSPPTRAEKAAGFLDLWSYPSFQPGPWANWKSAGAAAVCVAVLPTPLPASLPVTKHKVYAVLTHSRSLASLGFLAHSAKRDFRLEPV